MRKLLLVVPLFLRLVSAQTASFPSAVVTDQQMMVAANYLTTTSALSQASTDTILSVTSTTGFQPNMLVSVCSPTTFVSTTGAQLAACNPGSVPEIEVICSVLSSTQLQIGYNGSCPSLTGRGFNNTAAAAHTAGSLVQVNMDAWHHDKMRVEMEAVQQALGVNLSNIPQSPITAASVYAFGPITSGSGVSVSGGNLVIGNNTLTFATVPKGVNGTDANHWMYFSGGTGAAEDCLITGGSGTAGQTNGQIIVNCGATHSGAWSVQADAGGIREACQAVGGLIALAPGNYNAYQTITLLNGCLVNGQAPASQNGPTSDVNLNLQKQGVCLFNLANFDTGVENLALNFGTPPSYSVGGPATSGSCGVASNVNGRVEHVILHGFYNGLVVTSGTYFWLDVWINDSTNDGVVAGGSGDGWADAVISQANNGNGITLTSQAATQWTRISAFNNNGWGWHAVAGTAFQLDNADFENNFQGEMFLSGVASEGFSAQDVILQNAGASISWGTNTTAPCLHTTGNTLGTISNINIATCQGNGMEIDGNYLSIIGGNIDNGTGAGGVAGHTFNIESSGSFDIISGMNSQGAGHSFNGNGLVIQNNFFLLSSVSVPTVALGASFNGTFCDNKVQNGGGTAVSITAGAAMTRCSNSVNGAQTGTATDDGTWTPTLPGVPQVTTTQLYSAFPTFPPLAATSPVTDVAGKIWWSQLFIPANTTLHGACVANSTLVGTDKWIFALYNAAGSLVANTATAGTTTAGASQYQCINFTATVSVNGPQSYFIGLQGNGTHDTFQSYVTGSTPPNYGTGSQAGSFGTLASITPGTAFTTAVGPLFTVY